MGSLAPNKQSRVRQIIAKSSLPMSPRNLADCTGFDMEEIRNFLRNERKKERRKNGDDPDKHRSQEYRKRKSVRDSREILQEAFACELADCPPGRDPAEHERIVRMNFADA